jgi:hypothetical protein
MNMWQWLISHSAEATAITAVGALLTSFISVMLAIWALRTQRIHNLKSVAPFGELTIADYENRLKITLCNTGAGPLIVQSFRAYDMKGDEKNSVVAWMPALPDGVRWTAFTGELSGRCLAPGEERTILQLDGEPDSATFAELRDAVRGSLSGLHIEVIYRDIYDKVHPARGRPLDWFGRNLKKS